MPCAGSWYVPQKGTVAVIWNSARTEGVLAIIQMSFPALTMYRNHPSQVEILTEQR